MWAIRKASVRIKSQPLSVATFRTPYAKFETATSNNTRFSEPPIPPHISDRSVTLKRFCSKAHGGKTSLIGQHSFSSQDGSREKDDDDLEYGFSELDDTSDKNMEDEEAVECNLKRRRTSSGLFKAIVDSSSMSVKEGLDKWLQEGNAFSKSEISSALLEFRKRGMYLKALQLSKLLEANEKVEFDERDYAIRVDLLAKTRGLDKAVFYMYTMIPESFRRENVYRALLANCVLNTNTIKAEQVFNEIKKLKLSIITFAYEQMLLLYKRTDRRKMADVVSLMEKENIKPSLVMYSLLIDAKGQSNDVVGMEIILEKMKADGLEPDLRLQAVLARHYANFGIKEKANAVLKEMEGDDLIENRRVCSFLFPVYALLGSEYDVKRVWEICKSDPTPHECIYAIDAFGKLKKVEEAEAVFEIMSKKLERLSAKHYTAMVKVYAYSKMFTEGKILVRRMIESGCVIGPHSLNALVRFYLDAREIALLEWILSKRKGKPQFVTYMMILGEYAKRGDVNKAEDIFGRMGLDGYRYVSRLWQYNTLLQAYINAKVPAYGLGKRLKFDKIVPNMSMEVRLAHLDALKDPTLSDLSDLEL